MAIFWVDPYLSASTQGNGTTGNSRTGTYTNPFDIWDLLSQSNYITSLTVDSTTYDITDGDEFRLKGITHSNLFDDWGLGSVDGSGNWTPDNALSSAPTNNVISYDNTTTQHWTPLTNPPEFISSTKWGTGNGATNAGHTTTQIKLCDPSENEVKGMYYGILNNYDTNNKIRIYGMKSTYYVNAQGAISAGISDYTSTNGNLRLAQWNRNVTFTAGWDSQTTQNGHSIINIKDNSNFYLYTQKTLFDCERLSVINDYDNKYNYMTYGSYHSNNVTFKVGSVVGGYVYTGLYAPYSGGYSVGNEYVCNWVTAQRHNTNFAAWGSTQATETTNFSASNETGSMIYSTSPGYPGKRNIGTVVRFQGRENTGADNGGGFFSVSKNYEAYVPNMDVTFLSGSSYYSYNNSTAGHAQLAVTAASASGEGTVLANHNYGSNLKNLNYPTTNNPVYGSAFSSKVQPSFGEALQERPSVFANNFNLTGNLWWQQYFACNGDSSNIGAVSLGNLACSSANYTTTNTDLQGIADGSLFDTQFYCFDSNDYDGKPIIALPPTSAGKCALLYNDSSDRLVFQATQNGANTQYRFAIPVLAPSYTQGSDNLQLKIQMSQSSSLFAWSNSNTQSYVRVYYKDSTQGTGYRYDQTYFVVQSADTFAGVSISSTLASPSTHYISLSNLPSSGQQKITSAYAVFNIYLDGVTNVADYTDKLYFDNVSLVVQ